MILSSKTEVSATACVSSDYCNNCVATISVALAGCLVFGQSDVETAPYELVEAAHNGPMTLPMFRRNEIMVPGKLRY